jgi:hypothetical protein
MDMAYENLNVKYLKVLFQLASMPETDKSVEAIKNLEA